VARIVVTFNDKVLREVPLAGNPVRIGRDPACGIHLDNLGVSRIHAAILPHEQLGFLLEDLGSRNGTRLNGSPLGKRTVLVGGDLIGVGRHVLIFRADPGDGPRNTRREPPAVEKTIPLGPRPGKRPRNPEG
jgi:pSer/pThr/pTyr-binding forkhead associated (FHA) protein